MALGALFSTEKIMHTAVNSRSREIATLRAMGYEALPVATSVIFEAVMLSLLGGALGALAARSLFNGRLYALYNAVFELSVSAPLIAAGHAWAALLAFWGLWPRRCVQRASP